MQVPTEMNGPSMPVFAGQKLVVVGGSSGMGKQTAADVAAAGGSVVIIGQDGGKVDDTVKELSKDGTATGSPPTWPTGCRRTVRQQLAAEHADATLLVNAAGLFIPTPFLDPTAPPTTPTWSWTGPSSFSPRPWPAAWWPGAGAGRS